MLTIALASLVAFGDHGYGPVEPVALPDLAVTRHDGRRLTLRQAVGSGTVAVQFVFTSCQTVCPLLGSLFHNVDRRLTGHGLQLVSLTVDPTGDTAPKLNAWRKGFRASERWIALRTTPADLPRLLRAFGETDPAPAAHAKQIYFVRNGHYVARSTELPHAALIAATLQGSAPLAGTAPAVKEATALARMGDVSLTAEAARCANCHGAGAQGGREGTVVVPPLTAVSLLQPQSRRGGPPSRYTPASFCTALQQGLDPAGVMLSPVMPRYTLAPAACATLWRKFTGQDSQP